MANTKITSRVIADNSVGIDALNVTDGTNGQALVTDGSGGLSFASVGVSGIVSSADATAITIDSSENVGIGTTNPGQLLDVDGIARFGTSTYRLTIDGSADGVSIKSGTTANDDSLAIWGTFDSAFQFDTTQANGFLFKHSGDTKMTIDGVGEVSLKRAGSGGTGVLKALNLNHAGTSVNDGAKISFTAGASTEGAGIASTGQALNSADLRFYAGGNTERMRISTSGCVGVGSTVDRSLGANIGTLVVNGSAGGGLWLSPGDSSAMTSKIYAQSNGSVGDLIINNGTGVGSGGIIIQTNESEKMRINSSGLVRVVANSTGTGLCINHTDVRISLNQTNYGKYRISAAHVSGGTAHLGRKAADGYSTNALIAEYWGIEESWAKGAIAYKRVSSYDQGEFQWWLNATASGAEVSSADSKMILTRTGALSINGSLTQNASDERMKDNITLIPNALEKVKQLRGVSFTWREIENSPHEAGTEDIGVIAQDVEAVLPLIVKPAPFDIKVNTTDEGDEETKETVEVLSKSGENYKTVEYEKLVPLLIESIKELEARVAELEG